VSELLVRLIDLSKRFIFSKNVTLRKFLNFCIISFQSYAIKNSHVIGNPVELVIDPSNICNLHCPLCPTGQGKNERSKGKMSFVNFRKIIDELGAYLYRVDLHNWGEPFLNDEIYQMIRYAREHNIEVRVSSNLNVIDHLKAEKIVQSGLDVLIVSLDGASQETYRQYRSGGFFDHVTSNIKMIQQIKKELNLSKPFIIWQFLVMRHNEHELFLAETIAKNLSVNQLDFWAIRCDMGREIFWDDKMRIENAAKWLPFNEKYRIYDLSKGKRKNRSETCYFLWVQSTINWNGSVSPCCALYEEKYDFGNAFEIGFKHIWNNDKYRQARIIVRVKKPDKSDLSNVCSHCVKNGFI
jgi:radical SAM protein with 4Fe4S-binding SPASM domain